MKYRTAKRKLNNTTAIYRDGWANTDNIHVIKSNGKEMLLKWEAWSFDIINGDRILMVKYVPSTEDIDDNDWFVTDIV